VVVSNGHGPADAIATLADVTTDQKGAIAELAIQLAAIRLGIEVYAPVGEGGRCDMIFGLNGDLVRVQCKWASRYDDVLIARCHRARRNRNGLVRHLYTREEIDAFALYSLELDRCFFVPMTYAQGRQGSGFDSALLGTTSVRAFIGLTTSISGLHWADQGP